MKRPRHRLVMLTLGPAVALAVVATVVAQERRPERGDSTRGDSTRGDSSRGDSTRGDRGDRGTGRGRFERRSPTTLPAGSNGPTASAGPTTSPASPGTTQPSAVAAGS